MLYRFSSLTTVSFQKIKQSLDGKPNHSLASAQLSVHNIWWKIQLDAQSPSFTLLLLPLLLLLLMIARIFDVMILTVTQKRRNLLSRCVLVDSFETSLM